MEEARKPGTQTISAFDANYFEPGTAVATTIVLNDGSFGQTRIGVIYGYSNGPWARRCGKEWMII